MKQLFVTIGCIVLFILTISTYMYEKQDRNTIEEVSPKADLQMEDVKEEPITLQAVTDDLISYSLQEKKLKITYDHGESWVNTPLDKEALFQGEYHGDMQELIDGSYVLSDQLAAFIYAEDTDKEYVQKISIIYSRDQGETWQETLVTDAFPAMRFRKLEFLNEDFAYLILSGDRTMSQEYAAIYVTTDQGDTWEAITELPSTRLIAFGHFVDEDTGFLSYGTINPQEPDFFVTEDRGQTWQEAQFHMPAPFEGVFVQAEEPAKEGAFLSVLVNQGPNGDYMGGEIKGKFMSKDNGRTWEFEKEVDPNDMAEK